MKLYQGSDEASSRLIPIPCLLVSPASASVFCVMGSFL